MSETMDEWIERRRKELLEQHGIGLERIWLDWDDGAPNDGEPPCMELHEKETGAAVPYILASKYDETKRQRDEMLEALKMIVEPNGGFQWSTEIHRKVAAAIAKAEGTDD